MALRADLPTPCRDPPTAMSDTNVAIPPLHPVGAAFSSVL